MAEEPSCRSPYHEEYIQTSVSGNPEDLIVQLTAFYQGEDECRVSCCILTAYVHTVLEQQLYRFHPLLTEVVRYFR